MNIKLNSYLKEKPAWMQLLIFGGITAIVTLLISAIGFLIVARLNGFSLADLSSLQEDDFAKPEYSGIVKGLLVVQFFGVFFLPSLLFAYLADPAPLKFAGLNKPDRSNAIVITIIIIL